MLLQERTSTLSRHKYKSHTHTYMRVFWRAFPCASCFQNHQTSPHLLGLPKSPKSHNRINNNADQCVWLWESCQNIPKSQNRSDNKENQCVWPWEWYCFPIPIMFTSQYQSYSYQREEEDLLSSVIVLFKDPLCTSFTWK